MYTKKVFTVLHMSVIKKSENIIGFLAAFCLEFIVLGKLGWWYHVYVSLSHCCQQLLNQKLDFQRM
jgi:hypothetical protein